MFKVIAKYYSQKHMKEEPTDDEVRLMSMRAFNDMDEDGNDEISKEEFFQYALKHRE